MDYASVKEWLDKLVSLHNEAKAIEQYSNDIEAIISRRGIHLYKGIEAVADVMGIELKKKEVEYPDETRIRYFFYYSGLEFFQLSDKVETDEEEVRK